ncbi:unnamed protein product, partial [Ectocarpus sp. 12 AP-2014]
DQAEVVISRLIARKDDDADEAGAGNWAEEPLRHRYLLEPVDANARVALSVDPSDRSQPRVQAQVELGTISCQLEHFQLQGAMCLAASVARYGEVGKYFKHR